MPELDDDGVYREVLEDNNAQVVLHEIEGLENEGKLLVSRWIWELIQNARGTAGSQGNLVISIERTNDSLVFRHNGARFAEKEVVHLILHGSTKKNPDDIGRFGTGFITTHLLSRRVRVRGLLAAGVSFDFWLDRSANTPAELQDQMKKSWREFRASKTKAECVMAPFTTEFTYPIGNATSSLVGDAVDGGIKALAAAAPYLFAFNPMIQRLEMQDRGRSAVFEVVPDSRKTDGTFRSLKVRETADERTMVIWSAAADVTSALVVRTDGDKGAVAPCAEVPRLFLAFPLNGMERCPLPAVLNSEKFHPLQDRDGIPLAAGENEKNQTNQSLFLQGCRRIVELYGFAASQGWSGIPQAVRIDGDENVRGANPQWLKETVRTQVVEGLRSSAVLRTATGALVAPAHALVPMPTGNCLPADLWKLGSQLQTVRGKLPTEEEFQAWSESLINWRRFAAPDEKPWPEFWTIRHLAVEVARLGTLTALQAELAPAVTAAKWLEEFYRSLSAGGGGDLFAGLSLIPNQRGEFKSAGSLVRDGKIGEDLKAIADLLGTGLRGTLVDLAVADHEALRGLAVRTDEQVLLELLELVKKSFKEPIPATSVEPNVALFRALLVRGRYDKLDNFPVASLPNPQGKRSLIKLQTGTAPIRRWLAPVTLWPKTALDSLSVFAEAVVIGNEYAEDIPESSWTELVQRGFVHRDPVFTDVKIVNCFLPDEPLPDDEKDVRTEKSFEQSNVAWGTGDDHSIFDRARSSATRSIALLKFFLDHVLVVDPTGVKQAEAPCENGRTHHFYRAEWLVPLRKRSWVSIGTKKTDAPSVGSFMQLLAAQHDILARLNESPVADLFRAIGVAPSELMLRTIAGSDTDRMTLIQSIATIAGALKNDTGRVKALATALSEDADVIDIIEERKANRERVARNQKLGELVERIFAAVMGASVKVKRTGDGSDYALLAPGQDDGGRLEMEAGTKRVYVEIKATAGIAVRMSKLQAEIAVSQSDSYVLCVVPQASTALTEELFRKQVRFVFSIGEMLKPAWTKFDDYEKAYQQTHTGSDVAVEVGDHEIKFRIQEPAWKGGIEYEPALASLREKLLPDPSAQKVSSY